MDTDVKSFWQSKTVMAGIVTAGIGILSLFNVGLGDKIAAEQSNIVETVYQIATLVAGALAIYGRITANKSIGTK